MFAPPCERWQGWPVREPVWVGEIPEIHEYVHYGTYRTSMLALVRYLMETQWPRKVAGMVRRWLLRRWCHWRKVVV